jgi:hypothetical protein
VTTLHLRACIYVTAESNPETCSFSKLLLKSALPPRGLKDC